MTDRDVINRCTRDGHTSWQSVSRQLGRSVDSVRAQYDPTYLRSHLWAPTRSPEPAMAMPEDEDDTSSPYPKAPGLKCEILTSLGRHTLGADTLASKLNRPVDSIRARLAQLQALFLVCHDGRFPRTWSLTEAGRQEMTRCEIEARTAA